MNLIVLTFGGKTFARKLIRPFGEVKLTDIQNEIRAVEKLCKSGTHKNIVAVLNHGKLPPWFYFLDMELCDLNLESYINRRWTPALQKRIQYFTSELPSSMRTAQLWHIMEDMTCGVAFIHQHKEVHRDLKPRNGTN